MNIRRSKFIESYILSGNATSSAINAGYSKKTAYSQGQRLLKNVEIRNKLMQRKMNIIDQTNLTVDSILKKILDLYELTENDNVKARCLETILKHISKNQDSSNKNPLIIQVSNNLDELLS